MNKYQICNEALQISKRRINIKDLLKKNCFDTQETMIIVGSCLENMQPKAYKELEQISENIYEVCLEKEHLNMVVTKIIGMLARGKVKFI